MTNPQAAASRRPGRAGPFADAPHLVIWEMTQACDLACRHCRACAVPLRSPEELTTLEAKQLLSDVRRFGQPLVVLTGGDPLKRPDVLELVVHGRSLGLRMALTPSGTPLMTADVLRALRDAGLARLAVSLDGSTAAIHDAFRGVSGSYDWTIAMLREAERIGLPTQVNTTMGAHNVEDFDGLAAMVAELGIVLWSVFFVVPTGRAQLSDVAGAEQFERIFHRMADLAEKAPFDIKSTAAPQYRRVLLQRRSAERRAARAGGGVVPGVVGGVAPGVGDGVVPRRDPALIGVRGGTVIGRGATLIGRGGGVNDGDGFVFVSHRGDIFPSGFLPLAAGNVRRDDLVEVYRHSPLFRQLRDRDQLKGKCGSCEFRAVCGGSRARAYAITGDWLESDPYCVHLPRRFARRSRQRAAPVDGR